MTISERDFKRRLDNWLMNPPELEDDERDPDEPTSCKRPGRRGCGHCDACIDWGDAEYHRMKEEGKI